MGNFTTRKVFFALKFDLEDKEMAKLDGFLSLLDRSNVYEIISRHSQRSNSLGGRWPYSRTDLFATILYAFAMGSGSLREIEERCKIDLRYIYLMQQERPAYTIFCDFINQAILPNIDEIFSRITGTIAHELKADIRTVYLDGTKQKARPSKYKFVFKPTAFHAHLNEKIVNLFKLINVKFDEGSGLIPAKEVLDKAAEYAKSNKIDLSASEDKKRRHRTKEESIYESLSSYGIKALEYEEKEGICGENRNSYYRTDHDATAMCLKEDYYSGLGSNMHPAYSVQILVSGGLIASCYLSQSRSDATELIPSMEKYKAQYGFYPESATADSGYGNLANYRYLDEHGIKAFVKYQDWEGEVSGKRPPAYFIDGENILHCLGGRAGRRVDIPSRHPKKSGFVFYKVENCKGCPFMTYCRRFMKEKEGEDRIFEVNVEFQKYRIRARDLLLSPEGIEKRINRSCQVEGAFGVIKYDMDYMRFRRTSLPKVSMEFSLVALGRNIRRYLKYLGKGASEKYWTAPDGLKAERIKKPSAKKLCKRAMKMNPKQPNEEAKSKYKYKHKKGC